MKIVGLDIFGADLWQQFSEGWATVHEAGRPYAEGIAKAVPIAKPFVEAGDLVEQFVTADTAATKAHKAQVAAQQQTAAVQQAAKQSQPQLPQTQSQPQQQQTQSQLPQPSQWRQQDQVWPTMQVQHSAKWPWAVGAAGLLALMILI